jgi:D-xylose transport system substrate-binding protein
LFTTKKKDSSVSIQQKKCQQSNFFCQILYYFGYSAINFAVHIITPNHILMKIAFYFCVIMVLLTCDSCTSLLKKEIKIGFLIHATTNARWQLDLAYIKERAAEIGATLIIKDAEGDENAQLKQALELLNSGVDALIVVAVNQNTAGGIVREAHKFSIPVIGYDSNIKNSDLDYLVSFEYEKVGQYMIDYCVQKSPKGNYILLWGDAANANAVLIKNGQTKALDPLIMNGTVNIAYKTFVDGWKQVNAKQIMDHILDFYPEKIDVVVASNDPMALGAWESLSEHGYAPNETIIIGQDATLEAIHSMLKGGVTMSINKPIKELAYGSIDLVVDLVRNGKTKAFDKRVNNGRRDVPAKLFSPSVVDLSNLNSEIITKGKYTHNEVYAEALSAKR